MLSREVAFVGAASVAPRRRTSSPLDRAMKKTRHCSTIVPGGRGTVSTRVRMAATDSPTNGDDSLDAMRSRLEGLFGSSDDSAADNDDSVFDGPALRKLLRDKFTVEFDVQPVVRHDRVYIHVMWRYFEQVSFYMDEEQWAEHTQAVADLLNKWDVVEYFCDYINTLSKRPVVGYPLNVPIPNLTPDSPLFPETDMLK